MSKRFIVFIILILMSLNISKAQEYSNNYLFMDYYDKAIFYRSIYTDSSIYYLDKCLFLQEEFLFNQDAIYGINLILGDIYYADSDYHCIYNYTKSLLLSYDLESDNTEDAAYKLVLAYKKFGEYKNAYLIFNDEKNLLINSRNKIEDIHEELKSKIIIEERKIITPKNNSYNISILIGIIIVSVIGILILRKIINS